MDLNKDQQNGLKIAVERYKNNERYTVIAGAAGTGKTHLVSFIIDALNLDRDTEVVYSAYTGKATQVLRERGNKNACTLHKLLYITKKIGQNFIHIPKDHLDNDYKLIVVDEVSMVPKDLWELLLSHKIHVICCGDQYQLSPIGESTDVLLKPHVVLNQIMRQAEESEIIRIATTIRNGEKLKLFDGKEVKVLQAKKMVNGMFSWADQIICAKNTTRNFINSECRIMRWGSNDPTPQKKDKIICLHNNYDICNADEEPLVNGLIGTVSGLYIREDKHSKFFPKKCVIDFLPDGQKVFNALSIDYKQLTEGVPTINKDNWKLIPKFERNIESFDYGYCITTWKAQGSEYDKVLIIEENFPFDKEEHKKWLYTSITRAKEKAVIIRKY